MNKIVFYPTEENCSQDGIELKKINIFDNKLTVEIPSEMKEMTEENKNNYYPYENRPEVILCGEQGSVQITFQKMPKLLREEQVHEAAKSVAALMRNIYSGKNVGRVHFYDRGEKKIAWFVTVLQGKVKVKNLKFLMEIENCFTLGTLTYPVNEENKWEAVIKYIFASISENRSRNEKGRL